MNKTKIRKMMDVIIRVLGFNMAFRLMFGEDPLKKWLKVFFGMTVQYSIICMLFMLGCASSGLIVSNMDNVLREASVLVNITVIPLLTTLLVSFLLGGYVIAYYYNKWITQRLQIDIKI
ncbi:hypothetical protein oki184_33230 [Helicobacter pylori]